MSATNTFLVNPNYISLMGWKQIITESQHFRLIGTTPCISELPKYPAKNTLILADLSQPVPQDTQVLAALMHQPIDLLVVVDITHHTLIHQLQLMGVRGILTTHCDAQEVKTALDNIRLGKRFYCGDILEVMMQPTAMESAKRDHELLSSRELEVLQWIVKGQTTTQIADQLNVSTHTINSHRKNMLKKLRLTSPVELIVYAVKSGWIDLN